MYYDVVLFFGGGGGDDVDGGGGRLSWPPPAPIPSRPGIQYPVRAYPSPRLTGNGKTVMFDSLFAESPPTSLERRAC